MLTAYGAHQVRIDNCYMCNKPFDCVGPGLLFCGEDCYRGFVAYMRALLVEDQRVA
jgi:hypothetical protein